MNSKRAFLDTAFVVALVNQNDQHHPKALKLSKKFEHQRLVTTDVILLEIGNALSKNFKRESVEIIETIRAAEEIQIIELNAEIFENAFQMYAKYLDKSWGLVDCVSFVVMQNEKITDALTSDIHFRQAGFNILMG